MNNLNKKHPVPFGKYLLLDRINIGGMAEVWRGKMFGAGGFERLVAIKRILPNIAEDEEFIAMFIDEAKISVQLTHANIAQIYELGHIQNSYFIAMEYIPGRDMRAIFERCRKKGEPAPVPLSCYCIAKLCEGLDYAHRKKDGMGRDMNIVHRDISPQNVLVSYEGEVKIIDFGIAKAAGKATKTQAGILKGKFGYMSPEQIRGLPLDHRSDVFAIGICLYEMLTGERLFVGESDFSVLEKVRKADVLPPSRYNRRVPETLERIVLRALARDVDERYQYANELADDLQRFLITSESIFSRKDLMQYMKSTFAEEVDREKVRLQEFADVQMPDALAAELGAFAPTATGNNRVMTAPPVSPAAPIARPTSNPALAVAPVVPSNTTLSGRRNSSASLPRLTAMAPEELRDDARATVVNGDSSAAAFHDSPEPLTVPASSIALSRTPVARGPNASPTQSDELSIGRAEPLAPAPQPHALPGNEPDGLPAHPSDPDWDATKAEGLLPRGLRLGVVPDPALVPTLKPLPPTVSWGARAITEPESPQSALPKPAPARKPKTTTAEDLAALRGPRRTQALIVFSGVVVMLMGALLYLLLRPKPVGFLYVNVPVEARGKARLNVNGQDLGTPTTWPLLQRVPAGAAAILVSAEGFEPFTRAVQVAEGEEITSVEADLKPTARPAKIIVVTDPPDAQVKLNQQVVKAEGTSEFFVGEVRVGAEQTLEVSRAGYQPQTQTLTPKDASAPVKVNIKLVETGVWLSVTSLPPGATVLVDGREAGVTPARLKVSQDTQAVTLTKHCHEPLRVNIARAVDAKDAIPVRGVLHRQAGCR